MPTQLFDSDTGRANARKRHDGATPEQRRKATQPARDARITAATVDAKIELLGATMLDRFDAVLAELAELRAKHGDRIAA